MSKTFTLAPGRGKKRHNRYSIEGESVTVLQIACRLNLLETQVHTRLRYWRDLPGPITWAKLRGDHK